MKYGDRISAVFWFIFSIVMSIESYRLGLGSLHSPKAGFLPFLMSLIVGLLSLGLILSTTLKPLGKKFENGEDLGKDTKFKRETFLKVLYALILLFGYVILLNPLGFLLDTALLMGLYLTIIEPEKWYVAIIMAITAPLGTYIIFHVFLKVPMPRGLFWF